MGNGWDDPGGVFAPITRARIAYRAGILAVRYRLTDFGLDDLSQEAWARVLVAIESYNPAKGSPTSFARAVLDRWYGATARKLRKLRLRRARERGGKALLHDGGEIRNHHSALDLVDRRIDAEMLICRLEDPALKVLARLLTTCKVSTIREMQGQHRATLWRQITVLRAVARGIFKEQGEIRATLRLKRQRGKGEGPPQSPRSAYAGGGPNEGSIP